MYAQLQSEENDQNWRLSYYNTITISERAGVTVPDATSRAFTGFRAPVEEGLMGMNRLAGEEGRAGPEVNAGPLRIGVASILQETNTWSPARSTLDDFISQGLLVGPAVWEQFRETNTEVGGAMRAISDAGCTPVPMIRAWAQSSGRLTRDTLDELSRMLVHELRRGPIDGLVLSLHGTMAAEGVDGADAAILEAARGGIGEDIPIGVCLDLHANVTKSLIRLSSFVTGYHTYPHTDLADTGARTARLVISMLRGRAAPVTALAKRPFLIPAEAMSMSAGPLGELRARADRLTRGRVLDIGFFPVQPWLDVEELGFGVTVTTDGDAALGSATAESLASEAWDRRREFRVELVSPAAAIEAARSSSVRPFLISESADAPTAGTAGDSPAMIQALLDHGTDLGAYVTVTDPSAVDRCWQVGMNMQVTLNVGASIDRRFHRPVELTGIVERLGKDPVLLTGPSYTGMEVSMGRFAVVRSGRLAVLITERPAFTLDPATFVHAGLDPARADVIVVRSANGFRVGYPAPSADAAVWLDLPGASTPRLELLDFSRAPRPLYPIDPDHDLPPVRV